MSAPPKDGQLLRVKLQHGQVGAAFFSAIARHWVVTLGSTEPIDTHQMFILEADEGFWITSWAPLTRGSWSPYWDDLSEHVDQAPVGEIAVERWWIWNKHGHPPKFAWAEEARANEEARRLAVKHPGVSFIVMRSMRKFRVDTDEPRQVVMIPEPPWPVGTTTNCKRVGWRAFFEGEARDRCPFPPDRRDLKAGFEEGWDGAKAWKEGRDA